MLLAMGGLGCGGTRALPVESPVAASDATAAAGCAAQDPARWDACAGQVVTLTATRQDGVPSAPMLNGPGQVQDYFQVGAQPVIVLSASPIGCDTAELAGTLRVHDQGGAPGTPESWRGWVLDASAVTCR